MFNLPAKVTAIAFTLLSAHSLATVEPLGHYNVDLSQTSVSGISSGGFMAVQLHAAHAEQIVGIGVFAGGPYMCSGDNIYYGVTNATRFCMLGKADEKASLKLLTKAAEAGKIAPLEAQYEDKIWLFSGYNDGVVQQPTMDALYQYYKELTQPGNVYYKDNLNAGHAQITSNFGQSCNINGNEFINDCDYDGAGLLLQHIYGALQPKAEGELTGKLIEFDQKQFVPENERINASMADSAYAYIPANCANDEPCKVHIALHGCLQSEQSLEDLDFVEGAGYNAWADTNNLIVLYPQVDKSQGVKFNPVNPLGYNPKGCWDWWGYSAAKLPPLMQSDANYAYKDSVQIKSIWNMVTSLKETLTGIDQQEAPRQFTLTAADSSDNTVALYWLKKPSYTYLIKRAEGNSEEFTTINEALIQGGSFGDNNLKPETNYSYQLLAFNTQGKQVASSNIVHIKTGSNEPECEPYFGTAYELSLYGRAWMNSSGQFYAVGSNDHLGNANTEVTLIKTGYGTGWGYYEKHNCP